MYYFNCFFIYSILGFIAEMLFGYAIGADAESGVLFGPWTPIYGFASILIILISEKLFKNLHMHRLLETIIVFFVLLVILMLLEGLGGFLIEKIFGITFWDYTDFSFNIGKYISLEMGLLWAIISVFFIYVVRPVLDDFIIKIPKWLTVVIAVLFIVDFVVTFGFEIFW